METYLRRWDRDHAQGDQAGRVERIFQPVFAGIVSTTKLSLLGKLLIEISAMISLETQLKMVKGTTALRFRCMALGLLNDLFMGLENMGAKLLEAIMDSIRKPYTPTIGVWGGQNAKLQLISNRVSRTGNFTQLLKCIKSNKTLP